MSASPCLACGGDGVVVGYGCPGFQRLELHCKVCDGTGIAPLWQAEAVEYGERLRVERMARNVSLREEASRRGMRPSDLSDIERGVRPLAESLEILKRVEQGGLSAPHKGDT